MKTIADRILIVAVVLAILLCSCGSGKDEKQKESPAASPVTYHQSDDPDILKATEEARKTFRYFWKQVSLDFNRIVPALELACVKLPFTDNPSDPNSKVEHMWIAEIDFDGDKIRGVLINSPNRLNSVKQGDRVECTPSEIGDWMCVLGGEVYGGYTVQVARQRMNEAERASYDDKWGLDFPPPETVNVPPKTAKFEREIASMLKEHLQKEPAAANSTDDAGRTPLHLEALYGRKHSVKVLLDHGANVAKRCNRGWTPRDYAKALNWTEVIRLLDDAEAK